MWSLGYTQVRDQIEMKPIEESNTQAEISTITSSSTTAILTTTVSNLTITPSSFTELKSLQISEQNNNLSKENDDLTSSTTSECSDLNLIQENVGETVDGDLLKNIERKRNSLSTASGSDSETIDLNVIEVQDKTNENNGENSTKNLDKEQVQNLNSTDDFESEFVLIDPNQFAKKKLDAENESILKSGYKWQRELIFRSKLTMHTSFDRKDNSDPASVTALSISKDNRTIYVGDSRGRVYTWVCTENPGKTRADHWMRDEVVETCKNNKCSVKFTLNVRKHHCRDCGGIFCNNCTKYETNIPRLQIKTPVRVCIECYNNIKAEEALLPPPSSNTSTS